MKIDPDVAIDDPRVPRGARTVASKLVAAGWTTRLRQAVDAVDSISVAAVKSGQRPRFGIWLRKLDTEKWTFDGGWVLAPMQRLTSKQLGAGQLPDTPNDTPNETLDNVDPVVET